MLEFIGEQSGRRAASWNSLPDSTMTAQDTRMCVSRSEASREHVALSYMGEAALMKGKDN